MKSNKLYHKLMPFLTVVFVSIFLSNLHSQVTSPNSFNVTGAGTINYIPKWTSQSQIGNSIIYENNGFIGIGTINPSAFVHISDDNIAHNNNGWTTIIESHQAYSKGLLIKSGLINAAPENPILSLVDVENVTKFTVLTNGDVRVNEKLGIGQVSSPLQYQLDVVYHNPSDYLARIYNPATTGKGLLLKAASGNEPILSLSDVNGTTRAVFLGSGNVGIGTSNPSYKLSVNGTIQAKEIIVNTGWSDFVFEDSYALRSLNELEQYIAENGHLPEIPTAEEVEQHGVSLGEVQSKLLQKIEELTLYLIDLEKKNNELNERVSSLESGK